MQQAINLIPTTDADDTAAFETQSLVNRSEPIVLDAKLLHLIGGGESAPNKGW